MRLDLLLAPWSVDSESLQRGFGRRAFIFGTASAFVVAGLPRIVRADDASDSIAWKTTVREFARKVCGSAASRTACDQISGAHAKRVFSTGTLRECTCDPERFHAFFHPPFAFEGCTTGSLRGGTGKWLSVRQFPCYDIQEDVRDIKDMNAFEIRRVSFDEEIERFDEVLAACGPRAPLTKAHQAHFETNVRSHYKELPRNTILEYVRPFNDGHGRAVLGYGISAGTDRQGKPVRDLLLSSRDV